MEGEVTMAAICITDALAATDIFQDRKICVDPILDRKRNSEEISRCSGERGITRMNVSYFSVDNIRRYEIFGNTHVT